MKEERYNLIVTCGEGNVKSLPFWSTEEDIEKMKALFKRFNKTKSKGEQILILIDKIEAEEI